LKLKDLQVGRAQNETFLRNSAHFEGACDIMMMTGERTASQNSILREYTMKLSRSRAVALMEEMGQRHPQKWSVKRMQGKIEGVRDIAESVDVEKMSESTAKILGRILKVQEAGDKVRIISDSGDVKKEKKEPPKKAAKKPAKKAAKKEKKEPAKKAAKKPAKKAAKKTTTKVAKKAAKKTAAKKATKKVKEPSPGRSATAGKKVGVIKTIIEILKEGPILKADLLDRLCETFPDRPRESMASTMNAQCPTRLRKAGHDLRGDYKTGFFIKIRKRAVKKTKKTKSAKKSKK
jgi:hypothetical protein